LSYNRSLSHRYVRKEGDDAHQRVSDIEAGNGKYAIVDDFIRSGNTMERIFYNLKYGLNNRCEEIIVIVGDAIDNSYYVFEEWSKDFKITLIEVKDGTKITFEDGRCKDSST
jgi:hypothetical protein